MQVRSETMLETKRLVIGQMIVCHGCCCGATQKDRPEVPVEWLKDEWRKRGLSKRFQLTVRDRFLKGDTGQVSH
jgi:hypothetical protein